MLADLLSSNIFPIQAHHLNSSALIMIYAAEKEETNAHKLSYYFTCVLFNDLRINTICSCQIALCLATMPGSDA